MKLPKGLTLDDVIETVEADDQDGFCLGCGFQQSGCEPDAREYECDNCGAHQVYGASEILIMCG